MNIYIAGPVTGVLNYKQQFDAFRGVIKDYAPKANIYCPSDFVHPDTNWDEAMKTCLKILDICDMIILMPEWENSKGATLEREYAVLNKICVLNDLSGYLERIKN